MFKPYKLTCHEWSCNFGQLIDLYKLSEADAAFALAYRNCSDEEQAKQIIWQNNRLTVTSSLEKVEEKLAQNPRRWRLLRRLLLEKYFRGH